MDDAFRSIEPPRCTHRTHFDGTTGMPPDRRHRPTVPPRPGSCAGA